MSSNSVVELPLFNLKVILNSISYFAIDENTIIEPIASTNISNAQIVLRQAPSAAFDLDQTEMPGVLQENAIKQVTLADLATARQQLLPGGVIYNALVAKNVFLIELPQLGIWVCERTLRHLQLVTNKIQSLNVDGMPVLKPAIEIGFLNGDALTKYFSTISDASNAYNAIQDILANLPSNTQESIPVYVSSVDSIAGLRLVTGSRDKVVITVLGYNTGGDLGGGQFYWDANSALDDDGGWVIRPSSLAGNGRWRRVANDSNRLPFQYGAVGSGSAPDTPALTALLAGQNTINVNSGTFRIDSNLIIGSGKVIYLQPGAILAPDTGVTVTVQGKIYYWDVNQLAGLGTFTVSGGALIRLGDNIIYKTIAPNDFTTIPFNKTPAIFWNIFVVSDPTQWAYGYAKLTTPYATAMAAGTSWFAARPAGGALNGTTGSSNLITVSAFNGLLYLENRRASSVILACSPAAPVSEVNAVDASQIAYTPPGGSPLILSDFLNNNIIETTAALAVGAYADIAMPNLRSKQIQATVVGDLASFVSFLADTTVGGGLLQLSQTGTLFSIKTASGVLTVGTADANKVNIQANSNGTIRVLNATASPVTVQLSPGRGSAHVRPLSTDQIVYPVTPTSYDNLSNILRTYVLPTQISVTNNTTLELPFPNRQAVRGVITSAGDIKATADFIFDTVLLQCEILQSSPHFVAYSNVDLTSNPGTAGKVSISVIADKLQIRNRTGSTFNAFLQPAGGLAGVAIEVDATQVGFTPTGEAETNVSDFLNTKFATVAVGDSLPTADSTRRGHFFFKKGDTGVPDELYVCMKNGSNTYEMVQIL